MSRGRAVVGTQWGDEGKGKIVDLLAKEADLVGRCQGGNNAGHTIVFEGRKFVTHLTPAGIFYPDTICAIGSGVVLDPWVFEDELQMFSDAGISYEGRLFISNATNLIMPYHRLIDGLQDLSRGAGAIDTTKRGIGPCYQDKMTRTLCIRLEDLIDHRDNYARLRAKLEANKLAKADLLALVPENEQIDWDTLFKELVRLAEILRPMMTNVSLLFANAHAEGKSILFEGAQGGLLDVDLGTNPYTTSSNTTSGGIQTGLGIGPSMVEQVVGVIKAYTTRVGHGPFPTELTDAIGQRLHKKGEEFGATTGRPRRCGWLDMVLLKHVCRMNGVTHAAITKLDVLDGLEEIKVCTAYEIDGETITEVPTDMSRLSDCKPVYGEVFPGWIKPKGQKVAGATSLDQLPKNAKSYVNYICEQLDIVPIIVSTGADRKHTIRVNQ